MLEELRIKLFELWSLQTSSDQASGKRWDQPTLEGRVFGLMAAVLDEVRAGDHGASCGCQRTAT